MRARSRFWLCVWVVGFSVVTTCLLLGFKHHTVLDALQRERLQLAADEVRATIERSLSFGMTTAEISTLPDFVQSQRGTDPLIQSIEVVDAEGRVLHSTLPGRAGHKLERLAREALARSRGAAWHVRSDGEALQAAVARNSFGLVVAHAVVRYRLDSLDASSARFTRRLAAWGGAVALAVTLVLFFALGLAEAASERRIVRAAAAFEGAGPPGSDPLSVHAVAAREAIASARADLEAASAGLTGAAR